ncbi:MAG TPA: family 10 glycosylhydrolase [Micromonosporaceae bacterium]|nr:family 10 glycosylhydrolase [Micromonosporaceae bacterium]
MSVPPARSRAARVLAVLGALVVLLVVVGTLVEEREPRPPADLTADGGDRYAPAGADGRCGTVPTNAPRELRGMWLTTVNNIDWPSKRGLAKEAVQEEYREWLDLAKRLNHNAIFVHVRPSGDAFWPSEYAPWSEWLTGRRDGKDPGWDPMEFMIAEAHARNLEFHAWFNPYRGAQPATVGGPGDDMDELAPNHPLREHPEWAVVYPVGTRGSRFYFDPGIPEARRFVEDAMLEAVAKYDIDGVHFDDFFYPYPEAGQDFGDDASFAAHGKGFASKADWRRENVNTLVREMDQRIKEIKPWVKFGISPFGIWRNRGTDPNGSKTRGLQSYDAIYADTRKWVQEGWLDYIVPQLYWHIGFEVADYAVLLPWWSELVEGTDVHLYIGQADYRVGEDGAWSDPAELDRHLELNKKYNVLGNVHFSSKSVRTDALGAVTRYTSKHYATPALVPVMPQLPANPPQPPVITGITRDDAGRPTVRWRATSGPPEPTSFAIYRHDPGTETAQLVGTVRAQGTAEQSWVDPDPSVDAAAQYCVSGLDRSWNEGLVSAPATVAG